MVQKTFGIYSDTKIPFQLVIELGKQHLSCWQKEKESGKIYAFELFQFEKNKDENFLDIFRNIKNQSQILSNQFDEVNIVWENEQAVIIPKEFQNEEPGNIYLKLIAGNALNAGACSVSAGELSIEYYTSDEWKSIFKLYYPSFSETHKYCALLTEWLEKKGIVSTGYVWVLLYQSHFILFVFTKENLLLVNTFLYQTPEDVLYHILNVCERLQLNKDEVHFSFSGLIDVESNLFKTLEAYLRNIFFIVPSAEILAAKEFQNYPAHYFSSFLNIFP